MRQYPVMLVVALLLAAVLAGPAWAQEPERPVVDGVALEHTRVAGVDLFYDADVDPETLKTVGAAIERGLTDVPELTGLPAS